MRALLSSIFLVAAMAAAAPAQTPADVENNWHAWRGPHATGIAPHGDPPAEWSPEKNVKWKTPIPGRGSASPVVWGDKIFLLTAIDLGPAEGDSEEAGVQQTSAQEPAAPAASEQPTPSEEPRERERGRGRFGGRGGPGGFFGNRGPANMQEFAVVCVDRRDGHILWQRTARKAVPAESGHATNTFASASATTDGQRVYCSFGSQGIYAFDFDGKPIWDRDLGDMQTRNGFGEGASPTIYGDTLLVNWDDERESFITALDAATGEVKWKTPREEVTTWNTPLVVEHAGRTQVIVNGSNRSRSYDLASGKQIWECGGQATNPIACPIAYQGAVYCMTGHRGSAVVAISLDSEGDVTGSDKVVWQSDLGGPYVPSPLLADDRLYFIKSNNGILSCVHAADGKPIIKEKRLEGIENIYASPVGAAGRVYITGRNGTTLVIRDGADSNGAVEVLATNSVGEAVDASPAIVGREIFIRGENNLFCLGEP